ncbi:MAG: hypothetical protein IPO48_21080 [Saprospiraceae bacterium]|nr:hypothetical protein [Saprospiraceae bacterium]
MVLHHNLLPFLIRIPNLYFDSNQRRLFSVSDVDVTVNILPTVTIAGDNVICNGTSTSARP